MTIGKALSAINAYPIPAEAIEAICAVRGIEPANDATSAILTGKEYNLARADVLMWLSKAPNISQGGQNYSFNEYERRNLANEASAIIDDLNEDAAKVKYGYKGNRL